MSQDEEGETGSAVIEFVLVLPAVALMLLALAEVAFVARTQLDLIHASRVAAREAAAVPDPARAVEAALEALGEDMAARTRVSVSRPSTVGAPAEVRVTMPYRVFAGVMGGIPVELRARSVMRVER